MDPEDVQDMHKIRLNVLFFRSEPTPVVTGKFGLDEIHRSPDHNHPLEFRAYMIRRDSELTDHGRIGNELCLSLHLEVPFDEL